MNWPSRHPENNLNYWARFENGEVTESAVNPAKLHIRLLQKTIQKTPVNQSVTFSQALQKPAYLHHKEDKLYVPRYAHLAGGVIAYWHSMHNRHLFAERLVIDNSQPCFSVTELHAFDAVMPEPSIKLSGYTEIASCVGALTTIAFMAGNIQKDVETARDQLIRDK